MANGKNFDPLDPLGILDKLSVKQIFHRANESVVGRSETIRTDIWEIEESIQKLKEKAARILSDHDAGLLTDTRKGLAPYIHRMVAALTEFEEDARKAKSKIAQVNAEMPSSWDSWDPSQDFRGGTRS